ncbi:MAG: hypothetical protein E6J34_11530 [Chloroflexi bacterium]|nr:MAG: hypothetical protein E6J34_11530 [Chloroflexota bacterium]
MKYAEAFSQVMQAAIERASLMRTQVGKEELSLRGISQPNSENLFLLLMYLDCNEVERRWIFHLAGLATPEEVLQAQERSNAQPPLIHIPAREEISQPPGVLDSLELEVLSLQATREKQGSSQ